MAEILQLAGSQHITVPPTLLRALAAEPYNAATFVNTSLFDVLVDVSIPNPDDFTGLLDEDETAFNAQLEAEDDGKLQQVFFCLLLRRAGFMRANENADARQSICSPRCIKGWWSLRMKPLRLLQVGFLIEAVVACD